MQRAERLNETVLHDTGQAVSVNLEPLDQGAYLVALGKLENISRSCELGSDVAETWPTTQVYHCRNDRRNTAKQAKSQAAKSLLLVNSPNEGETAQRTKRQMEAALNDAGRTILVNSKTLPAILKFVFSTHETSSIMMCPNLARYVTAE